MSEETTSIKRDGKTKKFSLSILTFISVTAVFIIAVIIASIDNGIHDFEISNFFAANPDFDAIGTFMDPDITDKLFWQGNMGQLPSSIVLILSAILLIAGAIKKSSLKKQEFEKYIEQHPDWNESVKDNKKAEKNIKKEIISSLKIKRTRTIKWIKHTGFILLTSLIGPLIITYIFKYFWGRVRPAMLTDGSMLDFSIFTPWFEPQGFKAGKSFVSGHVAQATIMIAFAMTFIGSNKKWLAPLIGILSAAYVVLVAIGRMASDDHYFSDTVFGAYIVFVTSYFIYYGILFIPEQEKAEREDFVNQSYNEGYFTILKAKDLLSEKPEEALAEVSNGIELLQKSKEAAEVLISRGYDYSAHVARVDDLTRRLNQLTSEYQQLKAKEGNDLEEYLIKWSYVF
ncbi:MAG: phosphatase PAP2 family protein [Promethearchaeota archaeon]